jgi:hypothetical protein
MALMAMMATGKLHVPKNNPTFILGDGTANHGLFRFRGGKIPGRGMRKKDLADFIKSTGAPDKIQQFRPQPVRPPRWDWMGKLVESMRETFSPEFMFKNYILPAFSGIMPVKKPWKS